MSKKHTDTAEAVKAPEPTKEAIQTFVEEVVTLTKAEKDGVEKFAKEYLPAYLQYSIQAKSKDEDERIRGERMVGHIRSQIAIRASVYGIRLEQSMLEALWRVFGAAIGKI